MANLDLLDCQASKDNEVKVDCEEGLEHLGQLARRDLRGLMDNEELWAFQDRREIQDSKAVRDREVLMVKMEHQDLLERKASRVKKVSWVQLGSRVSLAVRVLPVALALLDLLAM